MAKYQRNRYGSIVMDGFNITKKEQDEYVTRVKRANSKRQYLLDKFYNESKDTPNMVGISKESYAKLLESKGFITEKLSSSFKGLTSKKELKQEIKDLRTINKKGYNEKKIEKLRKTMLRQIKTNLGSSGKDVFNTINNLSSSELASMYIHSDRDIIAEIFGSNGSVDDEEERAERTRSNLAMATNNILPKNIRVERTAALSKPKRTKIIKGKREKISKQR